MRRWQSVAEPIPIAAFNFVDGSFTFRIERSYCIYLPILPTQLAKESFRYQETNTLLNLLDETANRSHMSRAKAFEDTLQMIVCTLGRPFMEDDYMKVVARHTEGSRGKRGCDSIAHFFAKLVDGMTETNRDLLGDLFEGSITHGQRGQFLTPEPICELTARMNLPEEPTGIEGRKTVSDPCSGSGRMLLAAAEIQPHWHFVGQDVDLNCVRMTAINLGLRNRYGHVIWGNTLGVENRMVYETGRVEIYGNVIRQVPASAIPVSVDSASPVIDPDDAPTEPPNNADRPASQLQLFD